MSTPPSKVTVYGSGLSPFVRSVLMALESLGVEYENISVTGFKGETKTPEYLKVGYRELLAKWLLILLL